MRFWKSYIVGCARNKLQFLTVQQNLKSSLWTVDNEWEKLEKISVWNLTKVRSKKEVIDEARTKGARVHFASLMDICI